MATLTLRPNGAGTSTLWLKYDGTYNYESVDEESHDSDTTYVYCDVAGLTNDTYASETSDLLFGATINSVTLYTYGKYVLTGSGSVTTPTLAVIVRTNGSYYYGTASALTTSYAEKNHVWTTNPNTSAPWTKAEIDALEIGIRSRKYTGGASGVKTPRVTQVYAVVDYTPRPNPLAGHWELESDGADSSVNNYDLAGTTRGAVAGKYGNGLDFELGSADYIALADASCPNLEIPGNKTWSAWVKPESIGTKMTVMSKLRATGGYPGVSMDINANGTVQVDNVGLSTSANNNTSVTLSVGNWYHICYVHDSTNGKTRVFVNGVKNEVSATGTTTDSNAPFNISGNYAGASDALAQPFDGIIDDVRVYNIALTDEEVASLYDPDDEMLEGYWKLESDGSDTTANNYDVAPGTAPDYASGKFGNGGDFDGANSEYLTIANASCPLINITGSQTWSAWVKPESLTANMMVMSMHNGTVTRQMYINTGDYLSINIDGLTGASGINSNGLLTSGQWSHIAMVYDRLENKIKLFLNGTKQELTAYGYSSANNGPFNIGSYNNTGSLPFNGMIDDCAIWARALTDAEIAYIYNDGTGRVIASLGSGTDVTVSVSVQDLVLTQPTATVTTTRSITASLEVQTLIASQPTASITATKEIAVSLDTQTLTLSQPTATISAIRNISISSGTQSVTSSQSAVTISVIRNVTVSQDVQSLTSSPQGVGVVTAGNVSISPNALNLTVSQPSVSVTGIVNVTVSTDTLVLSASQPTATTTATKNVSVSQNTQSLTSSQPTATTTAIRSVTVSLDVQSLTTSPQGVGIVTAGNVSISPNALNLTVSQPSATTAGVMNITVSLDTLTLTSSQPTATATATKNITISTEVQILTSSQPTVTITAIRNVTVSTNVQALTSSPQGVGVATAGNVSISPNALSLTTSQPIASISAIRNMSVSTNALALTTTAQDVTVVATIGTTISPNVQALTISQPTISTVGVRNVTVSLDTQVLTASPQGAGVISAGNVSVSPSTLSLTASQPVATTTATRNVTIAPDVLVLSSSVQGVTAIGRIGITTSLDVQTLTSSQPTATVSGIRNVTISTDSLVLTTVAVSPSITAGGSTSINASVLSVVTSQPSPTVTATKNVTVSLNVQVLTSSVLASSITGTVSASVSVETLSLVLSQPDAVFDVDVNATILADVLTLTLEAQSPTIEGVSVLNVTVDVDVIQIGLATCTGPEFIMPMGEKLYWNLDVDDPNNIFSWLKL